MQIAGSVRLLVCAWDSMAPVVNHRARNRCRQLASQVSIGYPNTSPSICLYGVDVKSQKGN